jgi:hypothetical protein
MNYFLSYILREKKNYPKNYPYFPPYFWYQEIARKIFDVPSDDSEAVGVLHQNLGVIYVRK